MRQNMTAIQGYARLGSQPELKYHINSENEKIAVVNINLNMVNYKRKKNEDGFDDRSFWVNGSLWGDRAEQVARLFQKGNKVWVSGNLINNRWDNDEKEQLILQIDHIFPDTYSLESFTYRKTRSASAESEAKTESEAEPGENASHLENPPFYTHNEEANTADQEV